ncbi:hypothetical protein SPRG_00797 [Saprolegnia parasitica CBS 223.65]|uniref:ENTH domain-containing protein n=1 Tax=Saprolegnia parasitica (strain CBS 223.65) TaxID=695850 RepID=A0A067CZR2_SAPPC|nr:hypothetical protein SPRG_00797 [Saprolegnia parasitica CBS 223.65]KDO34735.1 hypothetical protein SPRG_00797 [Saprolegnia parasitica CBS 223.65]|eukprot:XP_012194404.1 hypothetical protein SPRG_00797 [Saprolegnia parasitica CBS 223.65]
MASREVLSEATSIHEGPVPAYLLDQIAGQVSANDGSGEKVADFLLGRMNKSNVNVRLKALQIINHCLKCNNQGFINVVREDEEDIQQLANGPLDPSIGDEKTRRIRTAAQEILTFLNGGAAPSGSSMTQSPQPGYGANRSSQHGGYGGGPPQGYGQQRAAPVWGNNNSNSNQYPTPGQPAPYGNQAPGQYDQRPAPYRDANQGASPYREPYPSSGQQTWGSNGAAPAQQRPSFGGGASTTTWGGSNSSAPTVPQYGQPTAPTYGQPTPPQYGQPTPPQYGQPTPPAYGHRSSTSSSIGDGAASVSGNASGVWGKGGFERRESQANDPNNIRWSSARDNRPTVLVGTKSSMFGPTRSVPPVGNPMMQGSGLSGIGVGMGVGGMSAPPAPFASSGPRLPTSSLPVQDKPSTAFSQKLDVIKKKGMGVIDMWDRRNMDKDMASSLAEHDDYVQTDIRAMDRGAAYNPGVTMGSSDKSGDYERTLIDDLCPPGGLARAPPSENLKRFVDLAKTLDIHTIGELLLDKLEDNSWMVRLKGLCVWEALLDAPGCSHYGDWLEENLELVQHLTQDRKSHVAIKAKQVLTLLGIDVGDLPAAAPKPSPARAPRASAEVDILGLGMGGLSVEAAPVQSPVQLPPVAATPPPMVTQNLLSFSPPMQPTPAPGVVPPLMATLPPDATRSLSDFGKDLFTLANSPRAQQAATPSGEKSAFSFM